MSVINQMLKDLDGRSSDSINQTAPIGIVAQTHSVKKIAIITGVIVLITCLVCFYIWHIISENHALKAEKALSQSIQKNNVVKIEPVKQRGAIQEAIAPRKPKPITATQRDMKADKGTVEKAANKTATLTDAMLMSSEQPKPQENKQENNLQPIDATPIGKSALSRVTPAKKATALTDQYANTSDSISHTDAEQPINNNKVVNNKKSTVSSMSVSRRQLSVDELAEQKLTLAEKALAAKQISKAEKLLEEVVIIKPTDSQTRKRLAALWYGRKAYRNAVNLLSQGIALDKKDSTLRELKARIHLEQGQVNAALNTLKPLSKFKNEQYQVMLANVAQQAQENEIAVNAYKMLIAMQPDIGRWQLGLAVLYDKGSEFNLASAAYKKALTKNDLSVSSENFIKQRIDVIAQ